jgi:riboflavin synthase alpha subunit
MFSGIIQAVGKIHRIDPLPVGGIRLSLQTGALLSAVKAGDSIAVDGVCLTVTGAKGSRLTVDVSPETLNKTNIGNRTAGALVNLELPVLPQSFISGHLVQGHVDGCAVVRSWKRKGADVRLRVQLPTELLEFCVPKGSITVNGVSLTIASMKGNLVEIALIPYTLEHTNLGQLKEGDPVNIEVDLIGKYVVTAVKKAYDRSRLQRGQRPRKPR